MVVSNHRKQRKKEKQKPQIYFHQSLFKNKIYEREVTKIRQPKKTKNISKNKGTINSQRMLYRHSKKENNVAKHSRLFMKKSHHF